MMNVETDGNAPPDSLLGQLQCGRGAGFLRALQEDASVVRPLLLDCLLHDPRWDRQVETRADMPLRRSTPAITTVSRAVWPWSACGTAKAVFARSGATAWILPRPARGHGCMS